jgi:hypothetical protein
MKQLIMVAKELNEVLGLEPPIPINGVTESKLKQGIEDAMELVNYETDEFSPGTIKTLQALGLWEGIETKAPEVEDEDEEEVEEEVEVEEDEEEVEEEEVGNDYSDLIKKIKATSKLDLTNRVKELKRLVKSYAVFESLRSGVAGKFDAQALRESMLKVLIKAETEGVAPQEKEVIEKKETKKPEKTKAAPKPEKTKAAPKSLYTRTDAVCDGLKTNPKTIEEWVEAANKAIVNQGGKANNNESRGIIKLVSIVVRHFAPTMKLPTE